MQVEIGEEDRVETQERMTRGKMRPPDRRREKKIPKDHQRVPQKSPMSQMTRKRAPVSVHQPPQLS